MGTGFIDTYTAVFRLDVTYARMLYAVDAQSDTTRCLTPAKKDLAVPSPLRPHVLQRAFLQFQRVARK